MEISLLLMIENYLLFSVRPTPQGGGKYSCILLFSISHCCSESIYLPCIVSSVLGIKKTAVFTFKKLEPLTVLQVLIKMSLISKPYIAKVTTILTHAAADGDKRMNGLSFLMDVSGWSKRGRLTSMSFSFLVLLWLHLDFTAGLLVIFFLVEYPFFLLNLLSTAIHSILSIFLVVLYPFLPILNRGGKTAVFIYSSTGYSWLTPSSSPMSLSCSPRPPDLSLCTMRPRPIPDAEAHGKDGNNCPEQLYLSNGECLKKKKNDIPPLSSPLFHALFSPLYDFYCIGSGSACLLVSLCSLTLNFLICIL